MESNPGTFGVKVVRVPPIPEDDTIQISLTLGDARRLHYLLHKGWPDNIHNSIWGLKERLRFELEEADVFEQDLG